MGELHSKKYDTRESILLSLITYPDFYQIFTL